MNAFARIDKDAFFRFVASRPQERYEYVRGRIVQQMTGGTRRHNRLAHRIARLIEDQLDAAHWIVAPERGVDTGTCVRYPELVIEPATEPETSLFTARPALIVEVLSPSTSVADLDIKPAEYMSLATLGAYLVASQEEPALLIWRRGADGVFPAAAEELAGLDTSIDLRTSAGRIVLRLEDIYRGIL